MQYVRQTTELSEHLRKLGFRFALEHFGTGRDPLKLLASIGMNFIKVDGSLMQGLRPTSCSSSASRAWLNPPSAKARDHRRTRRGRHTMAVLAARHRVHPGLFHQCPEDVTMSGER